VPKRESTRHTLLSLCLPFIPSIEVDGPLTTVTVGKSENLRVSFTVLGDDGAPVRPHQAFLRMFDEKSGEEGIQPIKVGKDGKGKVEIVSDTVMDPQALFNFMTT
jgi:hypothetical protein